MRNHNTAPAARGFNSRGVILQAGERFNGRFCCPPFILLLWSRGRWNRGLRLSRTLPASFSGGLLALPGPGRGRRGSSLRRCRFRDFCLMNARNDILFSARAAQPIRPTNFLQLNESHVV